MYLRRVKSKDGRIHLSIAHNYYTPGVGSKAKIIKKIGFLDKLEATYPDPIAHFTEVAREMNDEAEKENRPEAYEYDKNEKLKVGAAERNIGYAALSSIYHELSLDVFFNNHARKYKIEFSINSVVRLLVYMRVLMPGSKKKAYENRKWLFDKTDFSSDDVYRALTYISKMKDAFQVWMHEHIRNMYGRDTTFIYYDVTNYYFEIDDEDDLRRNGVCKEHRPDPIVQMGLFMDSDGIPIAYRLYPGNNNDCTTLVPFMKDIRREYEIAKAVVVADKGMNTAKNVYYIANRNNWYIFSQTVRGGNKELKKYVLNEVGYRMNGVDSKIKSRQFTRHVTIEQEGEKPPINADIAEKQVVFYSAAYAKKAKKDREKAIRKAKDIVKDPSKYTKYNTHGAAKYIEHLEFDANTGEIIEAKSIIRFDHERLAEDEKYDGYYLIATNAFDKDDDWIIEKYRGLWQIEETFKITKSDLEARPVFVSRIEHIEAHFLTCFIALTIVRILLKRLGGKYSPTRLITSLSHACCVNLQDNKYMSYYFDDILKDLSNELGIDFSKKYWTLLEIKKIIGETKR